MTANDSVKEYTNNVERLSYFSKMIVLSMPKYMPGKFMDKNIDYEVNSMFDFWGEK